MKKNSLIKTGLLALVAAAAMSAYAADEKADDKIPLDQVPQNVRDTLKQYAAESDVKSVKKGDEDGIKTYEFDIEQGAKKFEITISTKGKYLGREEDIALSDMPDPVQRVLNGKAAGAKISNCEKDTDEDGKITYEADIEKNGKTTTYTLNAAGRVLDTETDNDKD